MEDGDKLRWKPRVVDLSRNGKPLHDVVVSQLDALALRFLPGFWNRAQGIVIRIEDTANDPSSTTPSASAGELAARRGKSALGVVQRSRMEPTTMSIPADLLARPEYAGLGRSDVVVLHVVAHELFHCGQMDRQSKMQFQYEDSKSPFSQAVNPELPDTALALVAALTKAYPGKDDFKVDAEVKRLADSALEAQADSLGLLAVRRVHPTQQEQFAANLIAARAAKCAAYAGPLSGAPYDIADALMSIGKPAPSDLGAIANLAWLDAARSIGSRPLLATALKLRLPFIEDMARDAERDIVERLSYGRVGGVRLPFKRFDRNPAKRPRLGR